MKCFSVLGLASVAALVAGCAAPSAQTRSGPLALVQTIPLNGVSGRIDHLAVDVQGQRLFVAALGNGTVEVIDLAAGKRIAGIKGLKEPQGLCYIAELNRLVVASCVARLSPSHARVLRFFELLVTRLAPAEAAEALMAFAFGAAFA
ncbi:MAG: hypothetical protein NTU94_04665, partial [Planctomycetota bacterium]|nr:hypothetical protein [Planctomycetota bacterium]